MAYDIWVLMSDMEFLVLRINLRCSSKVDCSLSTGLLDVESRAVVKCNLILCRSVNSINVGFLNLAPLSDVIHRGELWWLMKLTRPLTTWVPINESIG